MADLYILKALANWLRDNDHLQEQLDEFAARWSGLRAHDARPCPKCYFAEPESTREQPLTAFPQEGAYEALVCAHCHARYLVPVPR